VSVEARGVAVDWERWRLERDRRIVLAEPVAADVFR
jgi:hypothetical protein